MLREVRQAGHISLHFLDAEAVLYDSARQCLYSTNTSATFIWCCLEEGMAPSEIARTMASRFETTAEAARAVVGQAIRQWRALKLVGPRAAFPVAPAPGPAVVAPASASLRHVAARAVNGADKRHYRLLDSAIALHYPPPFARIVEPALAPLATGASAGRGTLVEIAPNGDGYDVTVDGAPFEHCRGPEEILPTIKTALVWLALKESRDFGAFHAAGLARGDACLLLPGASGRGKTTLSTALAMTGFELLSDDTMVLAEGDVLAMRALPFGACLKPGAWSALASRTPQILDLPVHTRLDGIRVRYLLPPRLSLCTDPARRLPVRWIVFPHYSDGAPLRMTPVARPEALRRLMEGFCPLGEESLDARKVERLVDWIAGIECHELRYSSLDEATALMQILCS